MKGFDINTPRGTLQPHSTLSYNVRDHVRETEVPRRHRRRRAGGPPRRHQLLRREGPVQYEVDLVKGGKGYGFARCGGARKAALVDDHLSTQHGLAA
eukprot:scaffold89559_cov54-Phaeocystis_antarctica.AAC.4